MKQFEVKWTNYRVVGVLVQEIHKKKEFDEFSKANGFMSRLQKAGFHVTLVDHFHNLKGMIR